MKHPRKLKSPRSPECDLGWLFWRGMWSGSFTNDSFVRILSDTKTTEWIVLWRSHCGEFNLGNRHCWVLLSDDGWAGRFRSKNLSNLGLSTPVDGVLERGVLLHNQCPTKQKKTRKWITVLFPSSNESFLVQWSIMGQMDLVQMYWCNVLYFEQMIKFLQESAVSKTKIYIYKILLFCRGININFHISWQF